MKLIKLIQNSILILLMNLVVIEAKAQVSDSKYIQFGEVVQMPERINILGKDRNNHIIPFTSSKLTIIDFWNVWCTSCIQSIPKMQDLQEKFGDKIQILLVTSDSKEQVLKLMEKSGIVSNTTLPIITDDSIFNRMFKYQTVPTHVWIDSLNRLRYITDGLNTTDGNLTNYLNGETLSLYNKKYLNDIPLIKQLEAFEQQNITYYSFFAKSRPEYNGGFSTFLINTNHDSQGYRTVKNNIVGLINDTYRQINKRFSIHQMVYRDSIDGDFHNLKEWDKIDEVYCYEILMPNVGKRNLFFKMKSDIENGCGITLTLDTIPMKVLSLILLDENKIKSTGGERKVTYNVDDYSQFTFTNVPFTMFFSATLGNDRWNYDYLINNKVSYAGNIDVVFKSSFLSLESIRKELQNFGLKLIEEIVDKEVVVLNLNKYK